VGYRTYQGAEQMNTDDFKNEEEFDLYVKGAWDERARILALLEKLRDSEYAEVMTHDDLIALIKGDKEP
jgi:hypothetical protein